MTKITMTIKSSLRSSWDPTILAQGNRTILWLSSRRPPRPRQSSPCGGSTHLTSSRSWTLQWPACQATAGTSGSPLRRPRTRQTLLFQSTLRVTGTSTRCHPPCNSSMTNIFLIRDPSSTRRPQGTQPLTAAQRSHLRHAKRTRSVRWALRRRPSKMPTLRLTAQTLTVWTGFSEITVTWTTPVSLWIHQRSNCWLSSAKTVRGSPTASPPTSRLSEIALRNVTTSRPADRSKPNNLKLQVA